LVGYFLTPIFGWQVLYYLGTTAVLLALYIQFSIPESPIWLKMYNDRKKGIATGTPVATVGFGDLLKKENVRSFMYVVVICTSLMCTYWAVNTWLPTILARARGMSPKAYSSLLMVLQFVAAGAYFVGGWSGDKFGKRTTMAICSFFSAVTLYIWLGIEWESDMTFNLLAAVAWSFPSVIWAILGAYLVEQFPTNIRAVGVASGFSTGRLIATIIPLAMGAAAQKIGLTSVMTAMAIFYLICMFGVLMLKDSKTHI
jgi:putative MFS transporter